VADDVRLTEVRISDDRLDSTDGAPLVEALGRELFRRYNFPDADPEGLIAGHLSPGQRGAFFVAWDGDGAVGCGGIRRYDEATAEIKRMYVAPEARRRGIGRVVLDALEQRARELGYGRLILETGTKQPEAIALYESSAYERIDNYGTYRDYELSRCFAKDL